MQAHKLDAALQTTCEDVLSHLVQASNAVARTMELVKTYMHDRQELESTLPRWSTISDGHSTKKINKVRPMLIGGRTVQPFVLLDRTIDGGNRKLFLVVFMNLVLSLVVSLNYLNVNSIFMEMMDQSSLRVLELFNHFVLLKNL